MNYDEMSMADLKKECVKRKLGTGRSKQDLIDKLQKDDENILALANMSDKEVAAMVKESEPVDVEPAQNNQEFEEGSKLFRVNFPHVGPLLDSEHNDFRRQTRHLAVESGREPFGGLYAARLAKVKDGYLFYEIEVH